MLFTIRTREAAALGNIAGNDSTLTFSGLISIKANEPGVINSISYQKGDFVQEGDQTGSHIRTEEPCFYIGCTL